MVLEAARQAEAGATAQAIMERLREMRERMRIYFALDDLRFARLSGRVGMAQATLASLLQIKPLLTVQEGRLLIVKRLRSQAQVLRALVDSVAESAGKAPVHLSIVHAQAPETAQEVLRAMQERVQAVEVAIAELSIGIAVHLGPGTVGAVAYAVEG
jgi:DegV family protein with EDD domain